MFTRGVASGTAFVCAVSLGTSPAIAEYEVYFGGNLGVAFEDMTVEAENWAGDNSDFDKAMALVGLHAGVNHDMGDWFVGLEGDIAVPLDDEIESENCFESVFCSLDFKAHVRARIGLDHESWRLFAAGGFVFADVEDGEGAKRSLNGYTIGAGVEYHHQSSPWSARVEVLYDRFNDVSTIVDPLYNYTNSTRLEEFIVRGALTYTFSLNGS